ncbi:hypothetical protein NIE88_02845 [Sporolactobacillus shoreicorticis]|uniref:Carbohydrate-binding protein n=1 Tax=Sporolactobacillus shoreicorticis TaxID=1923877 RepID=A0ABW5S078_9BACL|nr:hypothetical protein [Sporolactobacillus shoreicorticis]MCO7124714.1 hypothetical protein [Sporolactobacillus shoreicorticis]
MSEITIQLLGADGEVKKERTDDDRTYLDFIGSLETGDRLRISVDKAGQYLVVQADEALNPSFIYLTGTVWEYIFPSDEELLRAYPKNAFKGEKKYMNARFANEEEINRYRNLALNSHDQKQESGAYPHAWANVETRNDSTFFARNAIDGVVANECHGSYPYQSWGINKQADAFIQIEFGRKVVIDKLSFVLRGDYPHDSYWTQATVEYSDGFEEVVTFEKVRGPQTFTVQSREIEWLKIKDLIKAEDESPFPALTEIEIYGKNS